ncbi:MAG: hypothetical protein HY000_20900 [Planctomycetes bacterium]|nr:hypothetical protein [Planctomycetota bacterium]
MKHISLDCEDERIQRCVRSLPVDPDGSVLELQGEPLVRVLPVTSDDIDAAKLKSAIIQRRRESRELNAEWEALDREVWDTDSDGEQ